MITVNFIAVVAAAVAAFIVGALWYGPLFGKQWRALMGFSDETMQNMRMSALQAMAGGFVATLVLTFVLANMLAMTATVTIGAALTLAVWIWAGFIATIMSNIIWYEKRPVQLYVMNAAHYLVAILVAAAVLAWWPW